MNTDKFLSKFLQFCKHLQIDSKEQGVKPLWPLYGSQIWLLKRIFKGLADNKRFFVVLKARQLGITTILLALDLFWAYMHEGLLSALVFDTDPNKEDFRHTLDLYTRSLPKDWKVPTKRHNKDLLLLNNRSRMRYLVAGTTRRNKGNLGRSKGMNYLHGTEVATWADEEDLASLLQTLAETHEDRLYLFESTAKGFNMFYDMWNTAIDSFTQEAIFIGWWTKELYRIERDNPLFDKVWDGRLLSTERDMVREVKLLYKYDIQPEQIAWYRLTLTDEFMGDEMLMHQEHPSTPDEAFIFSGRQFFSRGRLTDSYKQAREMQYDSYRFIFGTHFWDTELVDTSWTFTEAKIWQYPEQGGTYVLGCDPAFGGSEQADGYCIQVLRCYADRAIQVAEYRTKDCNVLQFAWVIAYLGGMYSDANNRSFVNLELNGSGRTVNDELNRMKTMRNMIPSKYMSQEKNWRNVVPNMVYFLYRRPDAGFQRGAVYHTMSTQDIKGGYMAQLRATFEMNQLDVVSEECLNEMRYIIQDGRWVGAEGNAKDDRVIALALANLYWYRWIMPELKKHNLTYAVVSKTSQDKIKFVGSGNLVNRFLKNQGIAVKNS